MMLFGGYDGTGMMNAPASLVERMDLVRIGTFQAEQEEHEKAKKKLEDPSPS
jgi:hypothetical protein